MTFSHFCIYLQIPVFLCTLIQFSSLILPFYRGSSTRQWVCFEKLLALPETTKGHSHARLGRTLDPTVTEHTAAPYCLSYHHRLSSLMLPISALHLCCHFSFPIHPVMPMSQPGPVPPVCALTAGWPCTQELLCN